MAKVVRPPRRGDVYWVNLDPTVGTEIRNTRPAVIVSNNSCNTHGTRVVVLPVTSNVETCYPGEARIHVDGHQARALGDQIRSIDTAQLHERIGSVSLDELRAIDEALGITLALPLR